METGVPRSFSETEQRLKVIQNEAAFIDRHRFKSASTRYSILGVISTLATPVAYSNDNIGLGGAFALATLFIIQANLKSQDMAKTYEKDYYATAKAQHIAATDYDKRASWEQPVATPA